MSSRLVVRATVATVIWLIVAALYVVYTLRTTQIPYGILEPAALGGFLGGIFSPLVLGWFALLYYEQTRALREAVSEQRRALLLQLVTGLRREFADNAYRTYGIAISNFIKRCEPEQYWVVFHRKFHSSDPKDREEIDSVDEARRAFSDYCDSVLFLDDDQMIMKVLKKSIVQYLHDTIWKLEIARDPNFDRSRFDRLWPLYGLSTPTDPSFPAVDKR